MRRFLRVLVPPTRSAGCGLILLVSGIAVLLPLVAALLPGSPT